MSGGPRFSLLSAMKKWLPAVLAVSLLIQASALAATPVDIYQDMESGQNGDQLTATVMNASNHGAGTWTAQNGTMWVGTNAARDLPGPVIVGGKTYNGVGGTRTWKLGDKITNTYVSCKLPKACSTVTTACYFTPGITNYCYTHDDTIRFIGGGWGVMQMQNGDNKGPYLISHACLGGNSQSPDSIKIQRTKTYWGNLHYDGVMGKCFVAVFDPDGGFAQVGKTVEAPATLGSTVNAVQFGRCDNHGNDNHNDTHSYFHQILVDYTNGAFPLLPSGGNDATPPGAPPAVRDGTGADQSIAVSTTQLSANWDPAGRRRERNPRLPVRHRHDARRHAGRRLDADQQRLGRYEDGLEPNHWAELLFQRESRQWRGTDRSGRQFQGANRGNRHHSAQPRKAVRGGGMYGTMGKDSEETTATTELVCNFDPATDAESGIRGYQYAIGTTPGATDVKNWSSLAANAHLMYVRVQNLNLTPGQRYYFTIRATNNAGLTGPAASSKGQTVVSNDKQPSPGSPAPKSGK